MIKIVIENVYTSVLNIDSNSDLYNNINDELSFFGAGYQYSKAFTNGFYDRKAGVWKRWDGRTRIATKIDGGLKFLTGLANRAIRILKSSGKDFEIEDKRSKLKKYKETETKNIEIREYQSRTVEAALKPAGGCLIKQATGAGKTAFSCIIMSKIGACATFGPKINFYVTGIDLLYQTKEAFEKFLGVPIGMIGDGVADIKRINVASIWTCSAALGQKYVAKDDEDYGRKEKLEARNKKNIIKSINDADVIFFDECHMSATQSVLKIKKASSKAGTVFGLSGTPWRSTGELDETDSLLIEAVCGEIEKDAEVTASELIKKGFLVKPIIHFVNVPEMKCKKEDYQSIYRDYIVENEVRNEKIINSATKLVNAGRKVLILVKNIKHGQILLEGLQNKFSVYFIKGDVKSEDRVFFKKEFENGNLQIIISTCIFDQGINLPNLDALILTGSGRSSGRNLQRLGRVIRPFPGKSNAIVVDFIDNCKYLLKHTEERIKTYRTEPSFEIRLPDRKTETAKPKEKKQNKNTSGTW